MKKYIKKEADVTAVVYDKQSSKKLALIIGVSVSISGNAWEEHQFITIGDNKNIPIKVGDYIVKDDGKFRVVGAVQFEADYELLKIDKANNTNKSNNTDDKQLESIEKGLAAGALKFEDMSEDDLRLYAKAKKVKSAHNMSIEKLITKLNEETK